MADKKIRVKASFIEGNEETAIGKTVLVYDSYANAQTFGATGLIANTNIFALNPLGDTKGAAITQSRGGTEDDCGRGSRTPDVGVDVDVNGYLNFVIDDNAGGTTEVFLASNTGHGRQPVRVDVANAPTV